MPQQRKELPRIKNLIPLTNGIFSHMNYTFREEVTKANLDIQFVANNGLRNISPVVESIDDGDGTVFDNTKLNTLAALILETYKPKWDKLGEIYDIQYDPIHNYLDEWEENDDVAGSLSDNRIRTDTFTHGKIVTEDISRNDIGSQSSTRTEDNSRTRTDNLTELETRDLDSTNTMTDNLSEQTTYGKTDTRTDNLTQQTSYGRTDTRTDNLKHEIKGSETTTPNLTNSNSVYPFNSASALPTDTATQTGTQTLSFSNRENDDTGTQTHALSGSDTITNTGTQQNVNSGSDVTANTGTRTTVNDEGGTVTTANTGTQTLVDDNEERVSSSTSNSRSVHDVTGYTGSDTSNESTSKSRTTTNDIDKTGRHFGNIGNLTSQKQILEEINLWRWNYVNEILNDVKEFTTLPVYLDATSYYA